MNNYKIGRSKWSFVRSFAFELMRDGEYTAREITRRIEEKYGRAPHVDTVRKWSEIKEGKIKKRVTYAPADRRYAQCLLAEGLDVEDVRDRLRKRGAAFTIQKLREMKSQLPERMRKDRSIVDRINWKLAELDPADYWYDDVIEELIEEGLPDWLAIEAAVCRWIGESLTRPKPAKKYQSISRKAA